MERNSSIDYIKGSLIFTVIIGHILLGSLDANLIRYVIYSFHMPAFFFISGYLLNIEKIRLLCFCQLIGKYWKRMLLPWSIAWVVYTAYVVYDNLSFGAVANNILNPYYHLWYVPSLFMMIVIVWTASRYFDNVKNILFFLFVTGILLFNFSNTPYSIGSAWNCRMLPFFALGIVGRRLLIDIKGGGVILIPIYLAIVICTKLVMGENAQFFRTYLMLPLAALLCTFAILPLMRKKLLQNKVLEYWGKQSLHIYLWHVVPIIVLKQIFTGNDVAYYIVSFALVVLFGLISYMICKIKKMGVQGAY